MGLQTRHRHARECTCGNASEGVCHTNTGWSRVHARTRGGHTCVQWLGGKLDGVWCRVWHCRRLPSLATGLNARHCREAWCMMQGTGCMATPHTAHCTQHLHITHHRRPTQHTIYHASHIVDLTLCNTSSIPRPTLDHTPHLTNNTSPAIAHCILHHQSDIGHHIHYTSHTARCALSHHPLPHCHTATLPHCHTATLPHCHTAARNKHHPHHDLPPSLYTSPTACCASLVFPSW